MSDTATAPKLTQLEVTPSERVLETGAMRQQLAVRAHFGDGTVRDVTRDVVYESSDAAVAV